METLRGHQSRTSKMLVNWTRLSSTAEAQEILRLLEDARYTSYDNAIDSSHNGIYCGKFPVLSIWDDNSYVGHVDEKDGEEYLSASTHMTFKVFKAMLIYQAGE